MKQRAKIFALFFLLVYVSFLAHGLFAHNHLHEHEAGGHCHFVVEQQEIHLHETPGSVDCGHVDDKCSLCENDGDMHQHVVFTRVGNHVHDAFVPHSETNGFITCREIEEIFISTDDPVTCRTLLTPSLRAPPCIS